MDAAIDAAIDADNPALVNRLKRRKGQLPDLINSAKADYDEKRRAFGVARERERQARLAHARETKREAIAAKQAALSPALAGVARAYREFAAEARDLAQLEQEISGRPAANEVDCLRGPAALFLAQGFARVLEWTWLGPDTERVHYRPALRQTGLQGDAELVVFRALFPNG